MGTASEVEYHLLLACDLDILPNDSHEQLHQKTAEVKRMLASFLGKLRADRRPQTADRRPLIADR